MAPIADILQTSADSVAAVGTAGALIVSSITLRHQQEDRRRAQASRIIFRETPASEEVVAASETVDDTENRGSQGTLYSFENRSDLPIFELGTVHDRVIRQLIDHSFGAGKSVRIHAVPGIEVVFADADEHRWLRDSNGQLKPAKLVGPDDKEYLHADKGYLHNIRSRRYIVVKRPSKIMPLLPRK